MSEGFVAKPYSSYIAPCMQVLNPKEVDYVLAALSNDSEGAPFEVNLASRIFDIIRDRPGSERTGSVKVITSLYQILYECNIPFTLSTLRVITTVYLEKMQNFFPYKIHMGSLGQRQWESIGESIVCETLRLANKVPKSVKALCFDVSAMNDLQNVKMKALSTIGKSKCVIDLAPQDSFEQLIKNRQKVFELSSGNYYFPVRKIEDFSGVSDL